MGSALLTSKCSLEETRKLMTDRGFTLRVSAKIRGQPCSINELLV